MSGGISSHPNVYLTVMPTASLGNKVLALKPTTIPLMPPMEKQGNGDLRKFTKYREKAPSHFGRSGYAMFGYAYGGGEVYATAVSTAQSPYNRIMWWRMVGALVGHVRRWYGLSSVHEACAGWRRLFRRKRRP